MAIREIPLDDKRERRRFVALERELLGHEPLFVGEIASDVDKRLRGRSPYYARGLQRLLRRRARRGRGGRRDAGTAERWLAERGAGRVIAPFNGASFHGLGAKTDAFDEPPIFPFPWQPPHYPTLLTASGYRPTYPYWIFEVDFSSERYRTVSRRALDDARCTVRPLDKKRWDAEVELLRSVFNETFRHEWEFHTMTSAELRELFDQFKAVLDPHQFLFAEVDGEPAGFCFGLPDWSPLVRSLHGKLGPLQIVRLLLRAKRYDRAGLLAIGVRESHRGRHIGQTLPATLYRRYEELGMSGSFYSFVNHTTSRRAA